MIVLMNLHSTVNHLMVNRYLPSHEVFSWPHLSDLRDELKDQKDEGLMAYIKEHIVVDEEKIVNEDVKTVSSKYQRYLVDV